MAALLIADFQQFQHYQARLDALQTKIEALVPDSPAAVLTTVPGITPLVAARYLAAVGHLQRFDHAGQVWTWGFHACHPSERRCRLRRRE